MENTIIVDKTYLSEVMDILPSKVLLNKGVTGCGGTHVELNSHRNSLILVPTIELANNKKKKDYLIVYGKVKNKEILDYINSNIKYKKIIGTYDCMKRLVENFPEVCSYFLLVDEYHILFNSYSFRNEAITYILRNFKKFDDYCFMTATPLDEQIILDEIKDLDRLNIEWTKSEKIKLNLIDTSFTNKELLKILKIDSDINYHIFLNSIKTIKEIIGKLDTDDYKAVCSEASRTKIKSLRTGSTLDKVYKYNFYTSTAFEGCDIYDPVGKTVILCDTNISTTILDISTLVRQICGRLRDSIYKDEITLVLNTTKHRYAGITAEDFAISIKDNITMGKYTEEKFLSEEDSLYRTKELRVYSDEKFNSIYINRYDDVLFYDDNLRKRDEFNYKLIKEIYNSSISVIKEFKSTDRFDTGLYIGEGWIINKLSKSEYSYVELEKIFKDEFMRRGIDFNGFTIKDNFPSFTKQRKQKNKIKETYYKFELCKQ